MKIPRPYFFLSSISTIATFMTLSADEADTFFDDSYVHEIRITFDDSDWYSALYNSHDSDVDDPYFPASFEADGVTIAQIGVRMKGNSSFSINSTKKSFKFDFDEYDETNDDLSFYGLKKLNLNNGFKDPTFMREKILLDFAGKYIPTIRAVHTRLYINDEYWGLYTAVEQVDKNFIQDQWGGGEDGDLYKGTASDDLGDDPQADFGSDLVWEGSDESAYYDHYQLKTNEETNDYSGLVEMIDILNNSDPDTFPTTLEPLMDIENVLTGLAIDNLFSNTDSYTGSAHNFYIYQSDTSGQFSHILWDTNEAFGSFTRFSDRGSDETELHPFWLPSGEERPLMEQIWENDTYAHDYLLILARMLREGFDANTMTARIEQLANLIRTDVYADAKKQYSDSAFEQNLYSSYSGFYGLADFVGDRAEYLESVLATYAEQSDLRINEIVAKNDSSYVDGAGDSDPWIEIYNPGTGEVTTSGLYLTDSMSSPQQWALPSVNLDDGEFLVIWMDGETSEGSEHASFTLSENGGSLYLFDSSNNLLDTIEYPLLGTNYSYQRYPDGNETLSYSDTSTPGTTNITSAYASITLYINEIMASNSETIQDPDGTGYPDWIELYNPNDYDVDLSGMYLTDDISDPLQWQVPDGVLIEAYSFLVFWADNDEDQGDTHMNFKLSSSGEDIALYDNDTHGNILIDLVSFGEQSTDVSYGRTTDGASTLGFIDSPTPGSSNGTTTTGETFWGYDIQAMSDGEWVDTGDWIGWLSVSERPWAWSLSWSNWLYMNETQNSSTGGWGWLLSDSSSDNSATGSGTYLGYTIQSLSGGEWIDTGSWFGWAEVSGAPWVYSYAVDEWAYIDEGSLQANGIWIWIKK